MNATAAKLFEENQTRGGPVGPHLDFLHAATYAELGREERARSMIRDLMQAHPDYPLEAWLAYWHENKEALAATMETLYRLGLPRKLGVDTGRCAALRGAERQTDRLHCGAV